MKVIFLDVDGVLNIMSPSYNTTAYAPDGSVKWMDNHLVQRLDYLIKRTGAKVVISSSWRLDMEDLQLQLEKNGFKSWSEVIGETPYFGSARRGDEIQRYLDEHPDIDCFAVLEDEIDDVCGEKCNTIHKLNVVEVDMRNGLSHQNVDSVYHILTGCQNRQNREELKCM